MQLLLIQELGVLGKQELATLLSKDRAKQMSIIQNDVNTEAKNFGIEIVDVRIKRADLPQANSEAIYARMQTERQREAKEFRAQGAEIATRIKSTADKEVTVILANAKKKSEIMKGEGDGQRNKIFADAFGKDPQFFSFYRAMQSYEKALIGGDTSLILSPDSDFFKFFGKSGLIKKTNLNHERSYYGYRITLFYRRSFTCHVSVKNKKYVKNYRNNVFK